MSPLQASNDFSLWDPLPLPLWVGTPDGQCLDLNSALCEFIGAPRTNLLGKGWLDFLADTDRDSILLWLASESTHRPRLRKHLSIRSRGHLRTVCAHIRTHQDPSTGLTQIIASLVRIPAHSKAGRALQLRNETLRLCFEHAPLGIGFLDLSLHFIQANPTLCHLLADSQAKINKQSLSGALSHKVPPEAALEIQRVCQETLRSGVPHALHGWPFKNPAPNTTQQVADWEIRRIQTTQNVPVGLLLTLSDVTPQKTMQERLRLLASVLESTPDFVAVLSPEGEVLYLNKAACHAAGLEPELPLHPIHIRDLQPEWAARILEEEGFPMALREGTWEGETAFTPQQGEPVPVSQILCAHKNASGHVEFFSTILRDISEALEIRQQLAATREGFKKRAEDRSKELAAATMLIREQVRQQAESANVAKNAFLSRMSHELRTPLNAILGFTQLLKLESPNTSQLESIGHITRAGRHLLALINEVLDIAHIESGRLTLTIQPLELNNFLHNCVEMMRPIAATSSVDLQFIGREKPFHVRADRLRLKQVVLNFLSNAIKYNNEGGMVLVSLRLNASSARFEVRDTGPGIPLEKRSRLFMPFERLGAESSDIEGTGIGLALCKGLLDAMDGTIGLENPDGGGCVFWAELPLADASELPQLKIESLPSSLAPPIITGPARPAKILAVESHDFDLHLLENLLQKRHPECEILSAMQGDLGLELAKEHHPDLILLDVDLPDLTPAEFLASLRANPSQKNTRVVLLGADLAPPELSALGSEYEFELLQKPLEAEALLQLLNGVHPRKD